MTTTEVTTLAAELAASQTIWREHRAAVVLSSTRGALGPPPGAWSP